MEILVFFCAIYINMYKHGYYNLQGIKENIDISCCMK